LVAWAVAKQHIDDVPVIDAYDPLTIPDEVVDTESCPTRCRRDRDACFESADPQILKRCRSTYDKCVATCRTAPPASPNVTTADSQPFPFYGTANVSWAISGPPVPIPRGRLQPVALSWGVRVPLTAQEVKLTSFGNAPLFVSGVTLSGTNSTDFAVASDQ